VYVDQPLGFENLKYLKYIFELKQALLIIGKIVGYHVVFIPRKEG